MTKALDPVQAVIQWLLESGRLKQSDVDRAQQLQLSHHNQELTEILLSLGVVSEQDMEKEMPTRQKSRFKSAAQFLTEKKQALIQEMHRAVLQDWFE